MTLWSTTIRLLKSIPDSFTVKDDADLESQIRKAAERMKPGYELEFEGYTDEMRVFVRRGNRRRTFINVQCEGDA